MTGKTIPVEGDTKDEFMSKKRRLEVAEDREYTQGEFVDWLLENVEIEP